MGAAPPTPPRTQANPPTLLNARGSSALKVPAGHQRCKCGNNFLPDAEFCRLCGATRPTVSQSTCYCGNTFETDEVFCRKCGAPAGAMALLVRLKTASQDRLRWRREDDPSSFEAWNVNAKLESEFAYMHSLLCNRKFVEVVTQEFKDFDTDDDGSLDQQEVAQAVPKMVLKHRWKSQAEVSSINHHDLAQDFFRQMDRDSDGGVSVDEFLVYLSHFHYLCYQQRVNMPEIFFYEGQQTSVEETDGGATCKCCKLY